MATTKNQALAPVAPLDPEAKQLLLQLEFLGITVGELHDAKDVLGDGYEQVKDKSELLNVPFIIVGYALKASTEYGQGIFVVVRAVTASGRKVFFVDGSTGIRQQIEGMSETLYGGAQSMSDIGIIVRKGLTVSEYTIELEGVPTKAKTYYFVTA